MTYSIIAKCSETGQYGIGIQSHFYAAGNACWANAGVGAVVTQAMALIDHGPLGLKLMAKGKSASEALSERLNIDPDPEIRQVAMLDSNGRVAAHTGSVTIPAAGHVMGEGFSCQANLMWNDTVPQEMADAFVNSNGDLAHRLLTALFAGQSAGGDIRGMQSGRILVVDSNTMDKDWEGILVDVNVDDHSNPLKEMERLLKVNTIYSDFTKNGYELELDKTQAEDGIRDRSPSRGLGDVYKRQGSVTIPAAGHVMGEGFSCQANLMWNDTAVSYTHLTLPTKRIV